MRISAIENRLEDNGCIALFNNAKYLTNLRTLSLESNEK